MDCGIDGYENGWQLLAAKLEEACPRCLETFVAFSRFTSLVLHMEPYGKLPSLHDMACYTVPNDSCSSSRSP